MKAIIFGISGQDGFYLKKVLQENNIECIGVSRTSGQWLSGDVGQTTFVNELIKNEKPDYIFHLAANSTTRHDALFENHQTIATGSLNILEAVLQHSKSTKVFLAGSGLQFVNKGLPISENDSLDASSTYCISRIQSLYAARYYRSLGLQVYFGYFFNHDSPLRSERHVNQKIVQAAKRMAAGSKEILELGNIEVQKEFTFAGDVAKAIFTLVQNDQVFECVIGSGKAYSIAHWLDLCFEPLKIKWQDRVQINSNFKAEYNILVSNPTLIHKLGWQAEVDVKALANMMLNFKQ